MRKSKRTRRWYISCRPIRKNDYQRALLDRHQVIFTKTPDEAELILLPQEHHGMTLQQKADLQKAINLGINCWIVPSQIINNYDAADTLERELMDRDVSASYVSEAEAYGTPQQEDELELAL